MAPTPQKTQVSGNHQLVPNGSHPVVRHNLPELLKAKILYNLKMNRKKTRTATVSNKIIKKSRNII